jgi:hypothetical protein
MFGNPLSGCLFVALVLAGIIMVALAFLRGGVRLGELALPYFHVLALVALGAVVVVLLPMSAFHQGRPSAALGMRYCSVIFAIVLWVQGLVLTYNIWGGGAVLLGLVLLGVGVVPMAMLATLLAANWTALGQLLLLVALTYATRRFARRISLQLQREERKVYDLEIV